MLNVENVATPFTAVTLVVPDSVPPPGFAPSATVINPVKPVTTFATSSVADPLTSRIVCPACAGSGRLLTATSVAGGGGAALLSLLSLATPRCSDLLATSV